jgi:hypothetical protein
MSDSIANERTVTELANTLTTRIPELAHSDPKERWTHGVFEAFKEYAKSKGWKLYPENGPYKGEYLLDFVLWEAGYGPRVVCESQWQHRFRQLEAIDWAFDKLRGVKGDVKVLIYEREPGPDDTQPPSEVREILEGYLMDMALLSPDEAFLFLNITASGQEAHWWKPVNPGKQDKIEFKKISLGD